MDFLFNSGIFDVLFLVAFSAVLVVFLAMAFKVISQGRRDRQAPRLTVEATLVGKRSDGFRNGKTYYATFQVESGDRMELSIPGPEQGLLVEGDRGRLTFQGTRYLDFQRE